MTSHDLATPLHTPHLAGLSRALFVTAEEDLLRDEAAEYARRLAAAGFATEVSSASSWRARTRLNVKSWLQQRSQ
jgi:acetyl esterase/lipase